MISQAARQPDREPTPIRSGLTPAPGSSRSQRFPRLTHSERRLGRWLREHLGMAGAESLIREFSAEAVIETLHDGILERFEPHPISVERGRRRFPATPEQASGTVFERSGLTLYSREDQRELLADAGLLPEWRPNPDLRNAGAFLRATLDRAARASQSS